jgi:hypothetical protein
MASEDYSSSGSMAVNVLRVVVLQMDDVSSMIPDEYKK